MSLTYSIKGISTAVATSTNNLPYYKLVDSAWALVDNEHDRDSGLYRAIYHLVDSGKEYPVHLIVQSTPNDTLTYNKVEIQTWVGVTDSVTGLTAYEPQTLFAAWKHAGKEQQVPSQVLQLFLGIMSCFVQDAASNRWTANAIRKLNDGNADIINNAFTDDAPA